MNSSGLIIDNISRSFGDVEAVRHVTLSIPAGEIHCLLGASGSGKSTLLRLIAGLERQDFGVVSIDDRVISDDMRHEPVECRPVGMVFQDYALFPHLNALRNVLFGMRNRRSSESRERAHQLLADVGLGNLSHAMPHTMSGGEQQRVALARAMARTPQVMLLDEPFSGLDVHLRADVRQTTLRVLRAAGIATLMVTHDPSEAISCADRISVMHQGNMTQTGTPQDVYRNPVDRQTAEIFGAVNCLPVEQRDGRLLTPIGEWHSPVAPGATEVFCRPEQLKLTKLDDPNPGSEFEVRTISREGPTLVYLLRNSEGLELTVRILDFDSVAAGLVDAGQVQVGLRPGSVNA